MQIQAAQDFHKSTLFICTHSEELFRQFPHRLDGFIRILADRKFE